ncbi:MAG: shikimate kinase [Desulfobacterales bacterium]
MDGKNNITLIGMPGAGKSTIGIILAKYMAFGFIDTDVLIQINYQKSLQQIMDDADYLHLRRIEETEILKINIDRHVIATGGSAVYSEKSHEASFPDIPGGVSKQRRNPLRNGSIIRHPGDCPARHPRPFANCMRSARSV